MIVEVSDRRAIDASASADPLRFTNHSCAPTPCCASARVASRSMRCAPSRPARSSRSTTANRTTRAARLPLRRAALRRQALTSEALIGARPQRAGDLRRGVISAKPARFHSAAQAGLRARGAARDQRLGARRRGIAEQHVAGAAAFGEPADPVERDQRGRGSARSAAGRCRAPRRARSLVRPCRPSARAPRKRAEHGQREMERRAGCVGPARQAACRAAAHRRRSRRRAGR